MFFWRGLWQNQSGNTVQIMNSWRLFKDLTEKRIKFVDLGQNLGLKFITALVAMANGYPEEIEAICSSS